MKIYRFFPILGFILIGSGLFSCTEFFSTSLAPWAARDPDKLIPAVTEGNVAELIAMSENSPDMSLAVLKKINTAVKSASGDTKAFLQAAALEAAVNAAGLSSAIMNHFSGEIENPGDAKTIVKAAISDMKNLEAASSNLVDILPDPGDTAAFDAFVAHASSDELTMAAVMLLAGEAKKAPDMDAYIDGDHSDLASGTPAEKLAANLALEAYNKLSPEEQAHSALKDLLEGLNLL